MLRYALVDGYSLTAQKVGEYLPSNYRVIGQVSGYGVVIEGRDNAGWTLDRYVLPRLGSGLMAGQEIDLSHPVMKEISQS